MTEAMPFLQKAILLSYAHRPLGRTRLRSSHIPQGSAEKFQQRLLTNLYVCIIIIIQ